MIELYESKDNGKRTVPYHTGRIEIGIAYIPKQKPLDARWVEHYRAPSYGPVWWTLFTAVSVAGIVLVMVTR
jgi:hypothetical protein